jgi:hypothetical protein
MTTNPTLSRGNAFAIADAVIGFAAIRLLVAMGLAAFLPLSDDLAALFKSKIE